MAGFVQILKKYEEKLNITKSDQIEIKGANQTEVVLI
jgi:hypothetical protein